MKKSILLLLIIFTAISGSKAQNTFAPIGAEWWYGGDSYDFSFAPSLFGGMYNSTWTDHIVVEKDTVVDGLDCRKLNITRNQKNGKGFDDTTEMHNNVLFVYDNPDTVFAFNERAHHFTPLYIYNTTVGDTVKLPTFDTLFNSKDSFSYVLDSVKMEPYDNVSLETFYTHTIDTVGFKASLNWGMAYYSGNTQTWMNSGKFVRKIGGYWGKVSGILPRYSLQDADGLVWVGDLPGGNLHCYSDTSISIKLSATPCDSMYTPLGWNEVAINNVSKSNFQLTVAPNPASGQINIQSQLAFENNSQLIATDILGRIMMLPIQLDKKKNASIDVSHWANGIYVLKFELGAQAYYQKISVQH